MVAHAAARRAAVGPGRRAQNRCARKLSTTDSEPTSTVLPFSSSTVLVLVDHVGRVEQRGGHLACLSGRRAVFAL